MSYNNYTKLNNKFLVNHTRNEQPVLPAGHYELSYIPDTDQLIFEQIKFNHDDLLELPSVEFQTVATQIDTFLTPESKAAFKQYGFIYKRSILMHGVPGTGKTCLVNRIANKVVSEGGIVLFNPDPRILTKAYKALDCIQPETNVVIVFEELDKLVESYEHELLNVLDGEVQRDNIIYLATTNFINKVPPRIMRPGRFSSIVEIAFPDENCRRFYLDKKIGKFDSKDSIEEIVSKTDGFTIDELKETVLATRCLNIPLDEIIKRINTTKALCKDDGPKEDNKNYFDEYDDTNGILNTHDVRKLTKELAASLKMGQSNQ